MTTHPLNEGSVTLHDPAPGPVDIASPEGGLLNMLLRDNQRMRKAGTKLAEAALFSIRECDGLHRLGLAVAEWSNALADEGDRRVSTPTAGAPAGEGLVAGLRAAYAKVAEWPERRMRPDAVADLGSGFNDLLELRNLVPGAADFIEQQANRLTQVEAERDKYADRATKWLVENNRLEASLAQALERIATQRAEVIEECAKVAESHKHPGFYPGTYVVEHIAADIRALSPATGTGGEAHESFRSCGEWADATFGPATPLRRLERAGEELVEAKDAPPDKLMEEIADTVICLAAAAHSAGGDLQAAIDAKMAINRKRQWSVRGDGTGYHIPSAALARSPAERAQP